MEEAGRHLVSLAARKAAAGAPRASEEVVKELVKKRVAKANKIESNLRSDVVNVLSKSRLPIQNISKEDRTCIKNLTKEKDMLILQIRAKQL